MDTQILQPTIENIKKCAKELVLGEIVAFPTETVYGLGANALNESAVKKIYAAKGRPSDNPLIVHVCCKEQIVEIVKKIPQKAKLLAKEFMPGALTLVFDKKDIIPGIVTGGMDSVAVRMPSHKVALMLIKESGLPICAPSANTSSRPSPTMAKHVLNDLDTKIKYILDGGECSIGIESTVLDVRGDVPKLLRQGGITVEEIEKIIGKVEIVKDSTIALCPGMKYKHYAPKAEVLFSAYYEKMDLTICEKYDSLEIQGKSPVIICMSDRSKLYGNRNLMETGSTLEDYAHNLFAFLRLADEKHFDCIIAEGVTGGGLGASIINRLVKSSGGQII